MVYDGEQDKLLYYIFAYPYLLHFSSVTTWYYFSVACQEDASEEGEQDCVHTAPRHHPGWRPGGTWRSRSTWRPWGAQRHQTGASRQCHSRCKHGGPASCCLPCSSCSPWTPCQGPAGRARHLQPHLHEHRAVWTGGAASGDTGHTRYSQWASGDMSTGIQSCSVNTIIQSSPAMETCPYSRRTRDIIPHDARSSPSRGGAW